MQSLAQRPGPTPARDTDTKAAVVNPPENAGPGRLDFHQVSHIDASEASTLPQAMRDGARATDRIRALARGPRISLCSRAMKGVYVLAGLLGAGAVWHAYGRTRAPAQILPVLDVTHPGTRLRSPTMTPAWMDCDLSPPAVRTARPARLKALPYKESSPPDRALSVTAAIDAALSREDSYAALARLAFQMSGKAGQRIPLEVVDLMVDAYRASPHWREATAMERFIRGMTMALGARDMSDAQLERLLHVWSWRYGDVPATQGPQETFVNEVLRTSIAWTLTAGMGRPDVTDSQLRLLTSAVGREPEGLPPGCISDPILLRHATWTGDALTQLMLAVTYPESHGAQRHPDKTGPARAKDCLRLFLQQPARDPRWKGVVVRSLARELPFPGPAWAHKKPWERLVLAAVRQHLEETAADLPPVSSIDEAIVAMIDPDGYRQGLRVRLDVVPKPSYG